MQRFIKGVRNFELKRNLALMYAPEHYMEAPPTVEALRFTFQQYMRVRGSSRLNNYPKAPPQQPQPKQQNQTPAPPPPAQNMQLPPQQPPDYRQQPHRACFNCGDQSHFVADCPLQQQVNSCHTNPSGGRTCLSLPHILIHEVLYASIPVQGTVVFCINCGRTGHSASERMALEHTRQEEQVRAAWYASPTNQIHGTGQDDKVG